MVYIFLFFSMTSQLLTRVPTELKKQFEQKVQTDGVSMNFIITTFIEEYVKTPDAIRTYVDDDMFNRIMEKTLTSPGAKKAHTSLFNAIKSA